MSEDYLKDYQITSERNAVCQDLSYSLFKDYKAGIIDKPEILKRISEQTETKYEAAMTSLFLGYMMSEVE